MNIPSQFLEGASKAELTGEQLRVLMFLLSLPSPDKLGARPMVIEIALCLNKTNVSRSLKVLAEKNLIFKRLDQWCGKRIVVINLDYKH